MTKRYTADDFANAKFAEHPDGRCTQDGCEGDRRARGLCGKHYMQAKRGGAFADIKKRFSSAEEAFLSRTTESGECLIWTGAKNIHGYGHMKSEGKYLSAHRYAWQRVNGPIPDDMFIDHTCWNKACVSIDHLRLASRPENNANLNGPNVTNQSTGVRNVKRNGGVFTVVVAHRHFGTFRTISEAAEAAESARREVFGEFAGSGVRVKEHS